MQQLAWLRRRFGDEAAAKSWESRAAKIKENLDKYCWNGKHYIHELHLNHDGAEGADENEILSLSNAYDMNRGITTNEQAESIINEYIDRRETSGGFAEWFTVNPPYKKFKRGDGTFWGINEYVNGGIASFTAGELAKAAFNYGFEEYGFDIICRLRNMMFEDGDIHFLYDPETGKNISGGPSGWSAAAILDAIDNGLAGIVDTDVCYRKMKFAPRWAVTDINELRYITGYESSKRLIETLYRRTEEGLHYELRTPSKTVDCHIYIPNGTACKGVYLNGKKQEFSVSKLRNSCYLDFVVENNSAVSRKIGWDKVTPIDIQIVLEEI